MESKHQMKTGGGNVNKKSIPSVAVRLMIVLLGTLLLFVDFGLVPGFGPGAALGANAQVTPINEITTDADGLPLRYPFYLFFDNNAEELYVATGGRPQIIIYARDSYPLISFSSGRGIYKPQGIFVDHNGMIYICQQADNERPARITILNGAFMIVREILFDQIPEASDFIPNRLVVSREGNIYVTSRTYRGVMVLDNDGVFLRWVRPEDTILYNWNVKEETDENDMAGGNEDLTEPAEEEGANQDVGVEIPEEFRPKTKSERAAEPEERIGPVMILSVSIDREGRLYFLSNETSKTYVYSPDETFLFSFGAKGGTPRTLSNPRGVAIDDDNHLIYVVDYMRHAVLAYDQFNGEYLFEFGGKGKNPGWFNFPTDIAVNRAGQVIVADFFNHRVQVLEVLFQREPAFSEQELQSSPLPAATDLPEESSSDTDLGGLREESNLEDAGKDEGAAGESAGSTDEGNKPEALVAQSGSAEQAETIPEQEPEEAGAAPTMLQESAGPEEETAAASSDVEDHSVPAAESPDFNAVEPFITSWGKAWEQQDIESYLFHYSRSFITPGGITLAAWEKQRHRSLGRPKFIKIAIQDMQQQKLDDDHVLVTFDQGYQSDTYSDRVKKTLELLWENGTWKIVKETSGLSSPTEDQSVPAVESPDFNAVEPFITSWVKAWQQQDIETYLSHYSRNFITPGRISLAAWEKQRHRSLGRPKFIKIAIEDMQQQKLDDGRVRVTFVQGYQSDIYSDQVKKTLELLWENGAWKIVKETSGERKQLSRVGQ